MTTERATTATDLTEMLRNMRLKRGMSVEQAATAIGLHPNSLYKLEAGHTDLKARHLVNLVELYGYTLRVKLNTPSDAPGERRIDERVNTATPEGREGNVA